MKKTVTVYSGIAIIFVLLAHSNAFYLHHINSNESYILMKIFMEILNIAVPMFIFISGYKYQLTRKNRDFTKYYVKKIKNIIKPTLIISLIWIVALLMVSILKSILSGDTISVTMYLKILIYRIFSICIGNNDIYQLWYIPMYILIVFTYPIIEKLINERSRMIIFLGIAIIQVVGSVYSNVFVKHPINFFYYYLLFEIGVVFNKREDRSVLSKKFIWFIFSAIFLLNIFIDNKFLNTIITKLVIYPTGVVIIYYITKYLENIKVLSVMGKYSFYIYVLHEPIILSSIGRAIKILGIYKLWIWVPIISCLGGVICIYLYKFTLKFKIGQYFWNTKIISKNAC